MPLLNTPIIVLRFVDSRKDLRRVKERGIQGSDL